MNTFSLGKLQKNKILNSALEECFYTNTEDFKKMIQIAECREDLKGVYKEKHHFIPQSFFKLKNLKVVGKGNLCELSFKNHLLIHYYVYKCSKSLIATKMAFALCMMCNLVSLDNFDEVSLKNLDFKTLEKAKREGIKKLREIKTKHFTEESKKEALKVAREKYNTSPKGRQKNFEYSQSKKGKEVSRKAVDKYRFSEKGKKKIAEYNKSEERKKVVSKYAHSEKGKLKLLEYSRSEQGKESVRRYQNSEKGKQTIKEYWSSEKGKEISKKSAAKRREKLRKTKCLYQGKECSLFYLIDRFQRERIPHSTLEAKRYIIS